MPAAKGCWEDGAWTTQNRPGTQSALPKARLAAVIVAVLGGGNCGKRPPHAAIALPLVGTAASFRHLTLVALCARPEPVGRWAHTHLALMSQRGKTEARAGGGAPSITSHSWTCRWLSSLGARGQRGPHTHLQRRGSPLCHPSRLEAWSCPLGPFLPAEASQILVLEIAWEEQGLAKQVFVPQPQGHRATLCCGLKQWPNVQRDHPSLP